MRDMMTKNPKEYVFSGPTAKTKTVRIKNPTT
jgi:hypothetical protein